MENHKNDLNSMMNWTALKSHRDEKTHIKIHRHLTDINDIISEDDIRNIEIFTVVSNVTDGFISKKEIRKLVH